MKFTASLLLALPLLVAAAPYEPLGCKSKADPTCSNPDLLWGQKCTSYWQQRFLDCQKNEECFKGYELPTLCGWVRPGNPLPGDGKGKPIRPWKKSALPSLQDVKEE